MIKLAFNKEKPNLVFTIDEIIRVPLVGGIVEYYKGTLKDTSTVPDTEYPDYKVQVMGFESNWSEVPTDVGGTSQINNQPNKDVTPTTAKQTVTADTGYTGLTKVTVNAAPITAEKNVHPSTGPNTVVPDEGDLGMARVNVEPMNLYEASITPTTDGVYMKTPENYDAIRDVTVSAVDATIDANIIPTNITLGTTILNVEGSVSKLKPYYLSLCNLNLPTGVDLQTYINGIDWSNINGFANLLESVRESIDTLDLSSVHNANPQKQYVDAPFMCQGVYAVRKIILPQNIQFKLSSGTRGPISFYSMFATCSNLEEIENLETWTILNTSYDRQFYPIGVDFRNMFSGCSKLKKVLLSGLSISGNDIKAKGTDNMFNGCTSLELLDLGTIRFDASSEVASINMLTSLSHCIVLAHHSNTLSWLHNLLLNTTNKEESYNTWNTSGHVHFNLNGGIYNNYKYQYGVAETVITLPSSTDITPPTGKVFDHWEDSEGNTLTTYTIQASDIGKDIEVYAIYTDA